MKKLYFALYLLIVSCAPEASNKPAMQIEKGDSVYFFSAEWCATCTVELPRILPLLKERNIKTVVFIETGALPSHPPTDQDVKDYQTHLALDIPVVADPWRWKTYHAYFPNIAALPTAVLLDKNEKIKKRFGPGQIADDIHALIPR